MKLQTIELREWRSFQSCDLEFPDGLIGVRGANGSGKTTIAEAVAWALFGKMRPGARVADLKRQGADGPSSVELTFRVGPTVYRVKRVVGGAATFWIGDGTEPESTQSTHTNRAIVRELGIGYDSFQRTVFARQKDVAALDPTASKQARTQHVERLLGLQRYRDAATAAKAKARELGVQLAALREDAPDLEELRSRLAHAQQAAADGDPAVAVAEAALASSRTTQAAAQAAVESERARVSEHERLVGLRANEAMMLAELETDLAQLREAAEARAGKQQRRDALAGVHLDVTAARRRAACLQALEASEAALQASPDPDAFGHDEPAARANAVRLPALRQELDDLVAATLPDVGGLQRRVAALEYAADLPTTEFASAAVKATEAARDAARDRASTLRARMESDEAHLAALVEQGSDAPCPVCLRPLGATDVEQVRLTHEQQLEATRTALANAELECTALEAERRQQVEVLDRARDARARLEAAPGLEGLVEARAAHSLAESGARLRATEIVRLRGELTSLSRAVDGDGALERRVSGARAVRDAAQARRDHDAAAAGVPTFDPDELAQASAHLAAQLKVESELRELDVELAATSGIAVQISTFEQRRGTRARSLTNVAAALATIALDSGQLAALRAACREAEQHVETTSHTLHEAKLKAQTSDYDVRELQTRVAEAEDAHAKINARALEHREYDTAAGLLADFRSAQSARAWPNLEQGASRLLSDTTDGRYADVRMSEDFRLEIIDRGERFGLDRYSGGEQDLANLCLRLSIADWVARERDTELGFVVLDEVFGSQDEDRRQRLLEALRSFERRFHQLLVITHVPEVADLCDHQLVVRLLEPGRSTAAFE
ncbi:SbcC-like subunit of palindrome specific endonuclease [Paraconexibacter sp. AEG42_29]|uniref:Nuclease SbcCD subunit C n=1 Tax=Paraconexibacter sp. AEG42_29 TaxID=2997339 RepID=A0AAU7B1Z3_9ACTN